MEKWYDNKQCNDCCNDKLDKLLESNIVERILFHYTCNNRSVVEIPISLSSVGFAPYSSPSFLHFLAMELSVKQCIIVHEHKRVTIVTVIQLCGSDLVGFPLPPISLKVVHTGILSCFSYIESIINYYWVLQRVKERERERERDHYFQIKSPFTTCALEMESFFILCKNGNFTSLTQNLQEQKSH